MITGVPRSPSVTDEHVVEQLTVLALLEPQRPLCCLAMNPEARAHAAWAFAVSEDGLEHWI